MMQLTNLSVSGIIILECNFSPNQLWIQGMLHFKNSGYQAVTDVTASKAVYFDIMGLMKEGLYLTCRVTMQFRYLTQLLL